MRPAKPILAHDSYVDLPFPLAGVDRSGPFGQQMPRQLPDQTWGRTTPVGSNVRAFVPGTSRDRGGSRSGLTKYIPTAVVADWIVQDLNVVVHSGGTPVQLSQSGRIVTLVAVSQGNVYTAAAGATAWTAATNLTGDTPPLNFSGIVLSSANNQKLWFADGVNYVFYQSSDNSVRHWTATKGSLPRDSSNNTPRLIATWRGRTVVSGLLLEPQNWFMSAVNDPQDFDYAPFNITPTQAVAGNNAPQGLIGDVITSLCPYTDDRMVFFGDHTIWLMSGDPMAGGQIDLVSDAIGGAFGVCWCKDPYGNIYFVSNKCGIYVLVPGQQPQRISQPIEQIIGAIDTGASVIRLIWDDLFQGVHIFITPTNVPTATTHLFYEWRTGSWWTQSFANNNHNPITCVTFDGNLPGDRVALIGSWDGFVRAFSPQATNDDGTAISSEVVIGPLLTKDFDAVLFKDIQAVLGANSGNVTFAIHPGATAEVALASPALVTGTWSKARNLTNLVRRSDHALYVRITSTSPWQIEGIRARIQGQGKVQRRGV